MIRVDKNNTFPSTQIIFYFNFIVVTVLSFQTSLTVLHSVFHKISTISVFLEYFDKLFVWYFIQTQMRFIPSSRQERTLYLKR